MSIKIIPTLERIKDNFRREIKYLQEEKEKIIKRLNEIEKDIEENLNMINEYHCAINKLQQE